MESGTNLRVNVVQDCRERANRRHATRVHDSCSNVQQTSDEGVQVLWRQRATIPTPSLLAEMATPTPRSRAATVTYSESEAAELQAHLKRLPLSLISIQKSQSTEQLLIPIEAAHHICQLFRVNATPNRVRDAFRHLNGFQQVLDSLRSVSQRLATPQHTVGEVEVILDVYQSLMSLLTAALQDHWGNRRYFRRRVENGGWDALKVITEEMSAGHSSVDNTRIRWRVFGTLLACALEDDVLNGSLSNLAKQNAKFQRLSAGPAKNNSDISVPAGNSPRIVSPDADTVKKYLGPQAFLHNPEAVTVAIALWRGLDGSTKTADESEPAFSIIPVIVNTIAHLSTHSLQALHEAGVLQVILPAFLDSSFDEQDNRALWSLAVALLTLGVTSLGDAHFLYRQSSSSKNVAELLRLALQERCIPPCFHFDLSLHGFASIELPDIGRTFPPMTSGAGYTLSLWLQIIRFDPDLHTTIFGAFDSSQTCFVLVYLEKDTRNLILQTSVSASRPSIRFKSVAFEANRWYHICIVHRRPKTIASSRASLFIDGEFVEQMKAQYPSTPPIGAPRTDNKDASSRGRKHRPVQAFFGTPQDLASGTGRGVVGSQWRLATAYLFSDTLSDDLIAVHKQLGPRYHGNYQDCLGSFQTYEASAALNLRNESLHPGKEEKSEIVAAIRSKAGVLLPENRIILNFSPMMVLDDDGRNSIDETQLIKSLSKIATKNLRNVTRGGRTAVAVNGAVASINEALLHTHGFAVLTGEPAIVVPQSLDDAAWRIGGCAPIGLALVESARHGAELVRALEILLSTIQDSWRNSEAMEKENGFGVLATLLTAKLEPGPYTPVPPSQTFHDTVAEREQTTLQVLGLILDFIGYRKDNLADSVINNPLAYRILIVDLDMWRNSSIKVQKLYYEQFTTFSIRSKYHNFNAKRLGRMRQSRASVLLKEGLLTISHRHSQEVVRIVKK